MPDIIRFDTVDIEENIELYPQALIDLFEEIVVSESYVYAKETLYVDVYELVSLLVDYVELGFTPKYIDVFDVSSIAEWVSATDIVVEAGLHYEEITVTEYVSLARSFPFNDILRGYPFYLNTKTGLVTAEFESGVVQRRDTWGRDKKQFIINFPVMTKEEGLVVQDFFDAYKATTFPFECPITGIVYTVMILAEEFILERKHFNSYFGKMIIEEVF
ncbi:hypothetical protein ACFL2J_08160 [Candidatus Omnitrophota bacterium]